MCRRIISALLALALTLCFCAYAGSLRGGQGTCFAEERDFAAEGTFVLPASLKTVEDEAFAGTASITDIYIPDATRSIADSAFSQTDGMTVHGVEGSYAEDWAEKHRLPFVVDDIWSAIPRNEETRSSLQTPVERHIETIDSQRVTALHERGEDEGKTERPQDRSELNPIDYRFP